MFPPQNLGDPALNCSYDELLHEHLFIPVNSVNDFSGVIF
jgi:hypothetical protein